METLIHLTLVLIIIGITKDIIILSRWFEGWMRNRGNGDPKAPAKLEELISLMKEQAEIISDNTNRSFDNHFQSLLAENKKTNDLLFKFLLCQKVIARASGIDLGDI